MASSALYRRYRPGRFAEVLGQSHAVRALQNAARTGEPGHAYLFSGPRGTGKTTSARILAKALNCEAPADGEPCDQCQSCLAFNAGSAVDLHELDAASNRGIDKIRELISTVGLGTPGKFKVYILDEVHQLTKDASAALLKVLEEPPAHVVWILATTDPQKVLPTIRSRTQHFEFNLLPADVLEKHVRWVIDDADLDVDDDTVAHVVRAARGSARDALSALDLAAAVGSLGDTAAPVDAVLDALAAADPAGLLAAVATLTDSGREPDRIAADIISALRDGMLLTVAPDVVTSIPTGERDGLAARAEAIGMRRLVRAIETLGTAIVDMRDAVDTRVLLEAALVRVVAEDEIADLQRRVAALEAGAPAAPAPRTAPSAAKAEPAPAAKSEPAAATPSQTTPEVAPPPAPKRAAAKPPATAKPKANLAPPPPMPGAGQAPAAPPAEENVEKAPVKAETAAPEPVPAPAEPEPAPAPAAPAKAGGLPSRDELSAVWADKLLDEVPRKAKARFAAGRFVDVTDGAAVFALPNPGHRDKCQELVADVEAVLAGHFGYAVPMRLVVDDGSGTTVAKADDEDSIDPTDLVDAPTAKDGGTVEPILEVFPGAEVIDSGE